jgi:anthranilate phosphoribosyltransferase
VSLRPAVELAASGREVPAEVLAAAFQEIVAGAAGDVEIAALLVALRTKGETVGEIVAAAQTLRAAARSAPCLDPRTIDTCGTGGDGAHTFNISTAAAFVAAGAGVPVAKHGGRAASSKAGSIDVLEALGVRVDLPVETAAAILERIGIGVFFAPRAHPAMRHVAPVRQALGIRTMMNCMGPLLNPLGVRRQLIGVYARDLVEVLGEALARLGAERALVVHGSDGLDEITTTGPTHAAWQDARGVRSFSIDPAEFGLAPASSDALRGGDAATNAAVVRSVLEGEAGARRDIVVINAAAAVWVGERASDLAEGIEEARKSIDSGAALAKLDDLVRETSASE